MIKLQFIIPFILFSINSFCQTVVHQEVITSPPVSPQNVTSGSGKVVFKADIEIILTATDDVNVFTADNGSDFHAYIIPLSAYAVPTVKLDGSFFVSIDNALYFTYEEKYREGTLKYKIYNYKRETSTIAPLPLLFKSMGKNYFSIDLSSILPVPIQIDERDAYYILEIISEKGDKTLLRFKYKPIR